MIAILLPNITHVYSKCNILQFNVLKFLAISDWLWGCGILITRLTKVVPPPDKDVPKILSPMMDVIFKMLMGTESSKDLLADFLRAVLDIAADELDDISIANPFLLQEYKGDKLGILDVKLMLKTGKVITIEVQVDPNGNK